MGKKKPQAKQSEFEKKKKRGGSLLVFHRSFSLFRRHAIFERTSQARRKTRESLLISWCHAEDTNSNPTLSANVWWIIPAVLYRSCKILYGHYLYVVRQQTSKIVDIKLQPRKQKAACRGEIFVVRIAYFVFSDQGQVRGE